MRAIAIVRRGFARVLGKKFCEIILVSEAELGRNFGYKQVRRVKEQFFCAGEFIFVYIAYGCCGKIVLEIADKLLL